MPDGGLQVALDAAWLANDPSADCPQPNYFVSLEREGEVEVDLWPLAVGIPTEVELGTVTVPARPVLLRWRNLEPGEYRLAIWAEDHDPDCCLTGDINVFTFNDSTS